MRSGFPLFGVRRSLFGSSVSLFAATGNRLKLLAKPLSRIENSDTSRRPDAGNSLPQGICPHNARYRPAAPRRRDYNSPRLPISRMRSAMRQALAWIVSDGLTARLVG